MPDSFIEELTRADLSLLAASVYERQARIWVDHGCMCPQCQRINRGNIAQCRCGISRDGLPEFGTPLLIRCRESGSSLTDNLSMAIENGSPRISEDPGEAPAAIEALAIIFVPAERIVKVCRAG
jgi:hypothetical protein